MKSETQDSEDVFKNPFFSYNTGTSSSDQHNSPLWSCKSLGFFPLDINLCRAIPTNKRASVVQWLGFHPSIQMSKVEVRVRFTAVAYQRMSSLFSFIFIFIFF
jgi:hypothetical protein